LLILTSSVSFLKLQRPVALAVFANLLKYADNP
jgi:hypothetical protein